MLFLAAELARARRARGLRLSQAEAEALICDVVCERARDGATYAEVERAGYSALGPEDVLDGVGELIPRIELEALFADGPRLILLTSPITRQEPPQPEEVDVEWLTRDDVVEVTNRGRIPIGVSSDFHFFEVNRDLEFERSRAWGKHLSAAAGVKVFFTPEQPVVVYLTPIAGRRVVQGHGDLVSGPLDEADASRDGLRKARGGGYRGA